MATLAREASFNLNLRTHYKSLKRKKPLRQREVKKIKIKLEPKKIMTSHRPR